MQKRTSNLTRLFFLSTPTPSLPLSLSPSLPLLPRKIMQTCLTKFFTSSNPDERFEYVFERERALEERRKKEREEHMRRLREDERRKQRELRRLASVKRTERERELKEAREEAMKRKYEGLSVLPGIYLGTPPLSKSLSLSLKISLFLHLSFCLLFLLILSVTFSRESAGGDE
jgi:hypothetical protein